MFWSAPLEAQLLALLVMRHPWFFGIVRAGAARKQGSLDSRYRNNANQSHGNLPTGPLLTTTTFSQGSPADRCWPSAIA
jgi:hypothetical protein